jgi:hypothetical protein
MPIENSAAKNFVAADSEFDSKNCVTADLEIGSQTMPLPVQKSAAKNYAAAGSEIGIQKLCCCRFRIQQQWWSHFDFTSSFFVFTSYNQGA